MDVSYDLQSTHSLQGETVLKGVEVSTVDHHLVPLESDHDDHLKALALVEGHAGDLVLGPPGSTLAGVEDHSVPAVEAGVEVEGDVAGLILSAEQVDGEPGDVIRN